MWTITGRDAAARRTIEPSNAFVRRKGPTRLACRTASKSSQSVSPRSGMGSGPNVEALWTTRSIGPTSAAAAPAIARVDAAAARARVGRAARDLGEPRDRLRQPDAGGAARRRRGAAGVGGGAAVAAARRRPLLPARQPAHPRARPGGHAQAV